MASITKIEWTKSTWNPVTGCSKISPGCKYCYAERIAHRLQAMNNPSYFNGFNVTLHQRMLDRPISWKKPRLIFVNSMSDLFHEEVPDSFIQEVFQVMEKAYWHQFQILTKRSDRLEKLNKKIQWPENVWMGVSIENESYKHRINHLCSTDAITKFLSIEPLLAPIPDMNLRKIDWVIVGGESGPHARPMKESWVLDIRDQCQKAEVPFFFKQWGGVNKKKNGKTLEGRIWNEMPRNIEQGFNSQELLLTH